MNGSCISSFKHLSCHPKKEKAGIPYFPRDCEVFSSNLVFLPKCIVLFTINMSFSLERYGYCIYLLLPLGLLHFSSMTFFNAGLYIDRQVPNMHVVFSIRFAVPLPAFKAVVGSFNKLSLVPLKQLQVLLFWGRRERE